MKLKPKLLPFLIPGAGALGLYMRIWLFSTGVDEQGLLLAAHPANYIMYILTAAALVYLLVSVMPLGGVPSISKLFPRSMAACVGSCIAAAAILVSTVADLPDKRDIFGIITAGLGLLAAAGLVVAGVLRVIQEQPRYYLHAAVTAYFLLHLVSQYKSWNIDPQLQDYLPQLMASVFLMLAAYHRTMLEAGTGSRRWYVFFNYGALYFCCISLWSANPVFYLGMIAWTATARCSLTPGRSYTPMRLPKDVLYCIETLEAQGHSAYAVGGCVRDWLLGLIPHDYDLCTSATPEQICQIFENHKLVRNGEKHGTIGVVVSDRLYEITTFRSEGGYTDSRHPDWVEFVDSVEQDLARRDFTINAMAYSPSQGLIDPFDGQLDLENKRLRTVGDPEARFREDALRILRGVRFAVRFHLTPEENTQQAMFACAELMDSLARERVLDELCKLLPLVTAQDLIRYSPIITQIIPELSPAVGFDQHSVHHCYDVYTHTAHAVEAIHPEFTLRLAALLHDIGKPTTFTTDESGHGHFYGHAKVGAQMADSILLRLKASNTLRSQVVFLVEHHMTPLEPDKKLLRKRLGQYGEDMVLQLLELQKADFGSKEAGDNKEYFAQVEALLAEIQEEDACLTVKDLAVNGSDLLALGYLPGPHIGECMKFLLSLVQDEILSNTKEDLLLAAREFFKNNTIAEDTL